MVHLQIVRVGCTPRTPHAINEETKKKAFVARACPDEFCYVASLPNSHDAVHGEESAKIHATAWCA